MINKPNNTNITTEQPIKNAFDTLENHTNDINTTTLPLYTILIAYKVMVNTPVSKLFKHSTVKELLTSIHLGKKVGRGYPLGNHAYLKFGKKIRQYKKMSNKMNIIKASHITPLCLEILITIYDICDFTDKYLSHFLIKVMYH